LTKILYAFLTSLTHACYVPHPSSWFNHPNNIWILWIMKLSWCSCLHSPVTACLRSKYSPQHHVLKHSQIYVFPSAWETKFHTHIKQQVKLQFSTF
jgi:hypothetical protein